jgi:hypothetical protein
MTTIGYSGAPGFPDTSFETASKLLRLGMSRPRRPVDDLIDRLGASDGARWLDSVLEAAPLADLGVPASWFATGAPTLDELNAVKERSKDIVRSGPDKETRLAGIAGYFLSIAVALRIHGELITGRRRDEVDAVLLDLAEAAPSPFNDLLSAATLVPSSEADQG